jgi:hypothetical protein
MINANSRALKPRLGQGVMGREPSSGLNPKRGIIPNLLTLTRTLTLYGREEVSECYPRERVKGVQ